MGHAYSRHQTQHGFIVEGLLEVLKRPPTAAEISAVDAEFAHTNIRSVAISNGLARLNGKAVGDYSAFRN